MTYTNWKTTLGIESGVITIAADREGGVNSSLAILVNKETGAVVVSGCPELLVLDSDNVRAHNCRIGLSGCVMTTAYPTESYA